MVLYQTVALLRLSSLENLTRTGLLIFFDGATEYVVGNRGETQFGWGPEVIDDIHSRINFAYLQSIEGKNEKWLKMLEDVIKGNSEIKTIRYVITDKCDDKDKVWGYIDHQSSAVEDKNTEIFENKRVLKDFIFGVKSKIVLDNDNH